ncbi:FitA-like ribbon-helix-helix domain-containing protein [Mucisphaera calidilacus]|uniref:Antitoxin FitA-like ribbon-helix-helix domain-containing protein n=1 Tax=Mucisphaera calidilacus TaxID=2527982 RepID=A0A518C1B0_9BACT|nr:toxin-antitoxin system [Mucisphaera calidilacus]QDU73016.1 hypothetical protein Pan265_28940 [Mucisphaera calidilacus]
MAQFVVRNIEDDVRDRLREQAKVAGCSMEEYIRDILRAHALRDPSVPRKGLGTLMYERFKDCGLDEPLEQFDWGIAKPMEFPD